MSKQLPQHILIIPDGNRRWAKKQGLSLVEAYAAGEANMEKIIEAAFNLDIAYLTVWGSSTNNLTERSVVEREVLQRIYERAFAKLAKDPAIHKQKVKLGVIGRWFELLPEPTQVIIRQAIEATKDYNQRHLTVLIGYSGVEEMLDALRRVAENYIADGTLIFDAALLKSHLWTADLPAVDLVIRTGGEPHWSAGCMMWEVAEAQLSFPDVLWPDFTPELFKAVLSDYGQRGRRQGA